MNTNRRGRELVGPKNNMKTRSRSLSVEYSSPETSGESRMLPFWCFDTTCSHVFPIGKGQFEPAYGDRGQSMQKAALRVDIETAVKSGVRLNLLLDPLNQV